MKLKGYLLAAIAAATYGTNPAFAVPLYNHGMNPSSVLFFRYILGLPLLIIMLRARGHSVLLRKKEFMLTAILGVLMGISSLSLFASYNYLNSGIASTLLFVYPIIVAIVMTLVFREKFRITTGISLVIMASGILLLLKMPKGVSISGYGVLLVMLSSLTYAIYLVMTNISKTLQNIPTLRLLFWQLLFGSFVFIFMFCIGSPITVPAYASDWINILALAILPTVISLGCTTIAIHSIGSTSTAIFGALEPVTAVILSVVVLNQGISEREIYGGILIIIATTLIIISDHVDKILLRMRKMFPKYRNN